MAAQSRSAGRSRERQDRVPLILGAVMLLVVIAVAASEIHREFTHRTDWVRQLDDPDPDHRAEALDRFSLTTDRWPIPLPCASLAERLRDSVVRDRARPAVSRVVGAGACVSEVLALADRDSSSSTRAIVARTLAFVPAQTRGDVLPRLVSWARRKDSSATGAIIALGQLGDTSDFVRKAIEEAFAIGEAETRREAVEAMSRVGSLSHVLRIADAAQRDAHGDVRAAGIRALLSLQDRPEVTPVLLAQLGALDADTTSAVRAAVNDARRQVERVKHE